MLKLEECSVPVVLAPKDAVLVKCEDVPTINNMWNIMDVIGCPLHASDFQELFNAYDNKYSADYAVILIPEQNKSLLVKVQHLDRYINKGEYNVR